MARLRSGEKVQVINGIYQTIRRHYNGLSEQDIASLTRMERRRLNNYLRELEQEKKIHKEGRSWFAG